MFGFFSAHHNQAVALGPRLQKEKRSEVMPKTSEDLLEEAKSEFEKIPSWDRTPQLLHLMSLGAERSQKQEQVEEQRKVISIIQHLPRSRQR